MRKLLLEIYKADVKRLLIRDYTTPLFNAAAQRHVEVMRYLLESHNTDIYLGSGRFANGSTALHNAAPNATVNNAIAKGLMDVVRLLLKLGGPLESFDAAVGTSAEKPHFLVAFKTHRTRVELLNEEQWEQRREEVEEGEEL